jgi:hypothetical protein
MRYAEITGRKENFMKHVIDAVKVDPLIGEVPVAHGVASNRKEAEDMAQSMLAANPEAEVAIISWGEKHDRKIVECRRNAPSA